MKFFNMADRPLAFDVKCGNQVVIPAGTRNVQIAFRQSHLQRRDELTGNLVNLNVYMYKGQVYHA